MSGSPFGTAGSPTYTARREAWTWGTHVTDQRDAEPHRPPLPRRLFGAAVTGRPDAPPAQSTQEPAWNPGVTHSEPEICPARVDRPGVVGDQLAFRTPMGGNHRRQAADRSRGRPYSFYLAGPHYPRAWDHDWPQDGRSCADLIPDMRATEWLDREHTNRALG